SGISASAAGSASVVSLTGAAACIEAGISAARSGGAAAFIQSGVSSALTGLASSFIQSGNESLANAPVALCNQSGIAVTGSGLVGAAVPDSGTPARKALSQSVFPDDSPDISGERL